MNARSAYIGLTSVQKKTFLAAFLGWTLDAFDFFILTFVIVRVATDFHKTIADITIAITLTLAMRPLGALIFGWIGDRYGRKTPLMVDIAIYSIIELLTAFSPNFTVFLVLRALYGVAMGGEWGLGAAMAMESLPPQKRGLFSGILQEGYMAGYLLAAVAFFLVAFTVQHFALPASWDWRGLFVIGVLPAFLVFYIRAHVPESQTNARTARAGVPPQSMSSRAIAAAFLRSWPLVLYTIIFMAAFNFMSHGTQDLYATFLQKQQGFSPGQTSFASIVAALGAIAGGIFFGWLSQRFGRRNAIILAGILAIAIIPLWAFSHTLGMLALGAFGMQFMVQGAWGIIPAHLNELSPPAIRATFPGFTYQIGNLISAWSVQIEATIAATRFAQPGGLPDYARALGWIAFIVIAAVVVFTALGYFVAPERRNEAFTSSA